LGGEKKIFRFLKRKRHSRIRKRGHQQQAGEKEKPFVDPMLGSFWFPAPEEKEAWAKTPCF